MRKFITSAAIGTAVLGGTVAYAATSVLPAFAQNGGQASSQDQQRQGGVDQANPDNASPTGHQHRRHRFVKEFLRTAAQTIGIQEKDLVTELKAGKSIADVANEHGVNPQTVIDAIVAKVDDQVDKAVQSHKISAERGAEIKAKAPEKVTKLVNAHRTPKAGANNAAPKN